MTNTDDAGRFGRCPYCDYNRLSWREPPCSCEDDIETDAHHPFLNADPRPTPETHDPRD